MIFLPEKKKIISPFGKVISPFSDLGSIPMARHFMADRARMAASGVVGGATRALFAGGSSVNVIDYFTYAAQGNAVDFGDLTIDVNALSNASNGFNDRGIFGNGYDWNINNNTNVISYVTISTTGNATDFGDVTVARRRAPGCSNSINERGCFGGGHTTTPTNIIDYITISTTGNAIDFGNLVYVGSNRGAVDNGVNDRGCWASVTGNAGIDDITISSTGNAQDFGDVTVARFGRGASNRENDRGVFGGGNNSNVLDYITISTTGNAIDFGDLSFSSQCAATSSGIDDRGLFHQDISIVTEQITISTTGNATNWGDATSSSERSGVSDG